MSATAFTQSNEPRFPPFPDPPDGVTIAPFSTFMPAGYRLISSASGDSIEVDVCAGIQTVKVLNEEEAAQKRKANRRKRNAGTIKDAEGRLIPWWEEWEEGEASRVMSVESFDGQTILADRVCMAADDFRVGRSWPEIAQGVRLLWDQFRLYIGLISSIPVYKKIKSKQNGKVDGPGNGNEASDEEEDVPKARQTTIAVDCFEQNALPGKQLEPNPEESTPEAQRLCTFLDDMEKTTKAFLSSYMSASGLIWYERNLFIAPTVLHFFFRFMLRNGVFTDSEAHLDNLKRALSVATIAQKELPLTAELGKSLPGRFDAACKELWGTRGSLSIQISAILSTTDLMNDVPSDGTTHIYDAFETELGEQKIEVISSEAVLDSSIVEPAMEDNLAAEYALPVEGYTTASWTDEPALWLMPLLGPTTFPLTMTTGIIESSTRRIRDVIAPGGETEVVNGNYARSVSTIEKVLEDMFFRVFLGPWVGDASGSEEAADIPRPVIAPTSRGPVVAAMAPDGTEVGEDEAEDVWNPYRDDVCILVEGNIARRLAVGMGLDGTWVQMVPETESERHPRECYWYIESLVGSFPSYYTEAKMIGPEMGAVEDDDD